MTEHMLKDMGGRKARRKTVHDDPITKLIKYAQSNVHGFTMRSDELEEMIAQMDVTDEFIKQFLMATADNDPKTPYWDVTGALMEEYARREPEATFHLDGQGMKYDGLFYGAKGVETIILENIQGRICHLMKGTNIVLNGVKGYECMPRCEGDTLIINNCEGERFASPSKFRRTIITNSNGITYAAEYGSSEHADIKMAVNCRGDTFKTDYGTNPKYTVRLNTLEEIGMKEVHHPDVFMTRFCRFSEDAEKRHIYYVGHSLQEIRDLADKMKRMKGPELLKTGMLIGDWYK